MGKDLYDIFTNASCTTIKLDELIEFLNDKSIQERIEFLTEILKKSENNNLEIKKMIDEYHNLLNMRDYNTSKTKKVIKHKKIKPTEKIIINNEIKDYEKEIKEVISMSFEEFVMYVEENEISYNFIMLGLIKEINNYRLLADEAYLDKDIDLINDVKSIVLDLQNKLEYLKNKTKGPVSNVKTEGKILFFETTSKRAYFLEDIKGLSEYNDSFAKLMKYFKEGNPYDVKYFSSGNRKLVGLFDSRDLQGKTRIFFKYLRGYYVIIGAIIKKADNTVGYQSHIASRYENYLKREEELIKSLNDEEFMARQQAYMDEVWDKFDSSPKLLIKKGDNNG